MKSVQDLQNLKASVLDEFQGQINSLTQTISNLSTDLSRQKGENIENHISRPRDRGNMTPTAHNLCRKCNSPGHFARACNWNEQGNIYPKAQCNTCGQSGHKAPQCVKYRSGNKRTPGFTEQDPREGR